MMKIFWTLKVINDEGTSFVWGDPFATEQAALDAALTVFEKEGVRGFADLIQVSAPYGASGGLCDAFCTRYSAGYRGLVDASCIRCFGGELLLMLWLLGGATCIS
ncbi:hypothetical protein [Roseovarius aestuarii]|uniref:Uncharacterized protein n=2 Tax=Roseovarius aestuarii TaxID=475083 RepID=A0A1X7BVQ9_9RHOB|nr:hypothetical protein [Roseovarius aestuarii]SMC13727.1 hypothetical protein ROA7745_03586 [Roseovarius aestuarii]